MPKSAFLPEPAACWVDVDLTAAYVLKTQKNSGEIPWSAGGKTDPWDHVECAMGLTVAGYHGAARKAYEWSFSVQNPDGSWWSEYRNGAPAVASHKDANMTAYVAVGVYHYYLATGDDDFLAEAWPSVRRAIDFTLGLQEITGEIKWAKRKDGSISHRALLTGSSSIYKSLTCAIAIARIMEKDTSAWGLAQQRLGNAIAEAPHLFDQSKSAFAMDWYYPVLSGAIMGPAAAKRIKQSWETFVMAGWGVRCVADKAWVTMAETSELVITLAAMGNLSAAETVFKWMQDKKYDDGAFWTGVTYPEQVVYTQEKTSWTSAAVLLAADVLYDLCPASGLFRHIPSDPYQLSQNKSNTL